MTATIKFEINPFSKLSEEMIGRMFKHDALIKTLVDNLRFRHGSYWTLREYEECKFLISINQPKLKDWYLFEMTMQVVNGLFNTTCDYVYLSETGMEVRQSRYETRHWYQGTGHENALVDMPSAHMLGHNVTPLHSHM